MKNFPLILSLALILCGCSTIPKKDILINQVCWDCDSYYVAKVPLGKLDEVLKNTFLVLNEINSQLKETQIQIKTLTPCPENVAQYEKLQADWVNLKKRYSEEMAKEHSASERMLQLNALDQIAFTQ